jgi:hypothetical protein
LLLPDEQACLKKQKKSRPTWRAERLPFVSNFPAKEDRYDAATQ